MKKLFVLPSLDASGEPGSALSPILFQLPDGAGLYDFSCRAPIPRQGKACAPPPQRSSRALLGSPRRWRKAKPQAFRLHPPAHQAPSDVGSCPPRHHEPQSRGDRGHRGCALAQVALPGAALPPRDFPVVRLSDVSLRNPHGQSKPFKKLNLLYLADGGRLALKKGEAYTALLRKNAFWGFKYTGITRK